MAPQNKPRKRGDLDVQAQEEFYQRSSGPVIGQRPIDQSPKKLAALQQIGAIPDRYTSWEQINDEFRYNVEVLGLTEQQTRNKLNLNTRNTNGKYYFSKYERYGAGNYINFREISTDLQPEATADLLQINKKAERAQGPRLKSPEQMLEDAVFAEEDEWGDRPKNKHDLSVVSSKERADAIRDAIRERLGGPPKGSPDVYDSGKQVHRGHGFAASRSNAGLAGDNIWGEVGSYNVYGHAGKSNNPRIHPDILFEVNAPPTAEFAAWYRDPELRKQRLYPGVPDQLMMAADEYGSEIYGSRGSGRSKTYTVGPATTRGGVINTPSETVPAKTDKLFQISSQLAAEKVNRDIEAGKVSFPYERGNEASKKKADEARAKYTETVRQSIAKPYLDQQSINLDPTSSPNTPIAKNTYQFTEKDFTPLQWKEFTAGGGNAAITQGKKVTEIIDQGRIARRNPNLMPTTPTRVIPSRIDKGLMPKLGPIGAGLVIGGALLSDNPAEAIPVAAETLTPLGDLQGAPEPAVTMVNVGGKLRPLNTDTNTLMDKPGYGLEQKGGQWREVQRGTGAASRQQSKVQADQLIPVPKTVTANTPTGVAQLKAMPKFKNIDLVNEAQYFIVNPVRSAFDRIFGKRDI